MFKAVIDAGLMFSKPDKEVKAELLAIRRNPPIEVKFPKPDKEVKLELLSI
jgi:hypothetical protein